MSDQVSDIAADFFPGVIDPDHCPQVFHFALQAHSNVVFLPGKAVYSDELNEKVLEPFLINQTLYLAALVVRRKKRKTGVAPLSRFDSVNLP